jgi:prephenate dehydratase/chorismate mutase
MELREIRERIDCIDREIVSLLEARMELSIRSGRFKERVDDPGREAEIMARLEALSCDLVEAEFRKRILRSIMDEGKRLQREHGRLVAFQGEHGAYGEMAARRLSPGGVYIPCVEFADVFKGVEEGYFDLGAIPVENLIAGSVSQPNDLLVSTKLRIAGEANVAVNHCLVAPRGTDYRQVRMVYSHPQALAQCHGFIRRNRLEPRPYYDTAGAAKMIAKEAPFGAAAIASRLAAELYDLDVIKTGIEDDERNFTRFVMISKEPHGGGGDKCSIVFATRHEAGALFSVLGLFAKAGINLTRISSAPRRSDPGNYDFFCDFEGSDRDERIRAIISEISEKAVHFNFLGCYPAAR